MSYHRDYINAGFRIFALHKVIDGECQCGNEECQMPYKHPKARNWQHVPPWDEEQLTNLEKYGFLDQGFGVLVDEHLVIDIDPRNGGDESYKRLCQDTKTDFIKESGFVVNTGGGGQHIYFNRKANEDLVGHLKNYKGIDFKSSGFVVGCTSLHKSGLAYETEKGHPDDLNEIPKALLYLLTRKETFKSEYDGSAVSVSVDDIKDMLTYVSPSCAYEEWVQIGMAIHHTTGGQGFELWDAWSSKGEGYDEKAMDKKWHSFGKSGNPVTIGTLIYHAEQAGYVRPVTFDSDYDFVSTDKTVVDEISGRKVDLMNPPALAGAICKLIEAKAFRPVPELYPIAALQIISLCAAGSYSQFCERLNLLTLGIVLSAAGKEVPQDVVRTLAGELGMGKNVFGGAGSFKEFIVNLIDADGKTLYAVDEAHSLFNSMKSKNANSYETKMEAEILTMSSTALYTFRGAEKREFSEKINSRIARLNKRIDDGENNLDDEIKTLEEQLKWIENGLPKPHFSLMGHSTPDNIDSLINQQNIGSGLLGRMIIVRSNDYRSKLKLEGRTTKEHYKKMEDDVVWRLSNVQNYKGEIKVNDEAKLVMKMCLDYYEEDEQLNHPVLGAIYARAYEQVVKISSLLGVEEALVKKEYVEYAFALVEGSISDVAYLLSKNRVEQSGHSATKSDVLSSTKDTVLRNCRGEGKTPSVIKQIIERPRVYRALLTQAKEKGLDITQDLLDSLVKSGDLFLIENGKRKRYKTK